MAHRVGRILSRVQCCAPRQWHHARFMCTAAATTSPVLPPPPTLTIEQQLRRQRDAAAARHASNAAGGPPQLATLVVGAGAKTSAGAIVEPASTCYILHGLLGSMRNWVTFARVLESHWRDAPRGPWRFVLADLRNHGESEGFAGPHTMQSCAVDVEQLFDTHGHPDVIIGHSLGGKVAMELARGYNVQQNRLDVCILDSMPGTWDVAKDTDRDSVMKLLHLVRGIEAPIPSRRWLAEVVRDHGFSSSVASWITSTVKRFDANQHGMRRRSRAASRHHPDQLVWAFDPECAVDLLDSYAVTDSWDVLEAPEVTCAGGDRVHPHLVVAGRSSRWKTPELQQRVETLEGRDTGASVHHLERSGHWVHVDAPVQLREILEGLLLQGRV